MFICLRLLWYRPSSHFALGLFVFFCPICNEDVFSLKDIVFKAKGLYSKS